MDKITSWTNLQTVLLTNISYPLLATTFTKEECEQFLKLALTLALLAIGMNRHFPRFMVYGNSNHYGFGILHLYDKQGYLHLLVILKFTSQAILTGNLMSHSYEAIK